MLIILCVIIIQLSQLSTQKMNKPAYINKSKRTKLQQKKAFKQGRKNKPPGNRVPQPIDLDSDLESSSNQEQIQKLQKSIIDLDCDIPPAKPLSQVKEIISQPQYNRFNYSRLAKLAIPVNLDEDQTIFKPLGTSLDVVMDEGKIDEKERDSHKAYTFYVEGSTKEHNVRKIMLKGRATMPVSLQTSKSSQKKAEQEGKDDGDDKADQDLCDKKHRYFQISHELCYKCGKEGHYAKNCISDELRKCKTCFSREHDQRSCPQICFECGGVGHIGSDCPESRRNKCQRCDKRGHTADCCGVLMGQKLNFSQVQEHFSESDLRKMKCIVEQHDPNKKGFHFNCFQYKQHPMPFHQLRSKNKNEQASSIQLQRYRSNSQRYRNVYEERNFDIMGNRSQKQQNVYDHYRDRYQRQYGNEDRRTHRQDRSFSQQWDRGHTPQHHRDHRQSQSNKHRHRGY